MSDYETARRNMVENQLRPSQIFDTRLLDAMGSLPRELFVPKPLRGVAYADEDIPLTGGAFLVEPLALAKLIQAADIRSADVVLVVGDSTGYAGAVVSRLAATVFLLLPPAIDAGLVEQLLNQRGCENVVIQHGQALQGLADQAPFDVILLIGSVDRVPPALLEQLAQRGRLATVVEVRHSGRITVCERIGDAYGRATPDDANLPRLPGLPVAQAFEL